MNDLNEYVEKALNADCELSREEKREKNEQSDASTKAHGVKGRTAVKDEELRHKRIRSNFYGTQVNFDASILAEISESANTLRLIVAALQVMMTAEEREKFRNIVGVNGNGRN